MQSLIGAAYVNIGAAHVFCMTARIFGSHSFRCGRGQGTGRIQGEALYFGKLEFDQADGVWMDVTQRIRVSGCAKPCVLVVNAPATALCHHLGQLVHLPPLCACHPQAVKSTLALWSPVLRGAMECGNWAELPLQVNNCVWLIQQCFWVGC